MFVIITRHLPILLRRDHRLGSPPLRRRHDRVAVVGLVGDDRPRLVVPHQRLGLRDVRLLPRRQDELDRIAEGVDDDVELRAESAPGTAEGLTSLPPFFPAAC